MKEAHDKRARAKAKGRTKPKGERVSIDGLLRDAVEWVLDVAERRAAAFPDELDAVARVRRFVDLRLAGHRCDVDPDDVLLVLGLVMSMIELPGDDSDNGGPFTTAPAGACVLRLPRRPRWELPMFHLPGALSHQGRRAVHA